MSLSVSFPNDQTSFRPKIAVLGVGGAGGNAVHNMIKANLDGVEFMVTNTDAQALHMIPCDHKVQLGSTVTAGLGAGSDPEVGRQAAEESLPEIMRLLDGANMVFITAGMGGGTGTGAAPVIARAAREAGILTVGVVTKPFDFEGLRRKRLAEQGIAEISENVDTLLVIPNQNLFRVANDQTTFAQAFRMADEVLFAGVQSISDLMTKPGLVNLDFADIRSLMTMAGKAMLGVGEASGETRAIEAAEAAIFNPLLDDVSVNGAQGALINIAGGPDMSLFEVDAAASRIRDVLAENANVIFGTSQSEELNGKIRVSLVATGIGQRTQADSPNEAVATGSSAGVLHSANSWEKPLAKAVVTVAQQPAAAHDMQPAPQQDHIQDAPHDVTAAPVTALQPQFGNAGELGLDTNPFAATSSSFDTYAQKHAVPGTGPQPIVDAPKAKTPTREATAPQAKVWEMERPEVEDADMAFDDPAHVLSAATTWRAPFSAPAAMIPGAHNPLRENHDVHANQPRERAAASLSAEPRHGHNQNRNETYPRQEHRQPAPSVANARPAAQPRAHASAEATQARQAPGFWPELVVDNYEHNDMDEDLIDIPAFLRRQAN